MKKLLLLALLALPLVSKAQVKANGSVVISGPTTEVATLAWKESSSCPSTANPCTYQINGILGTCPATVVGSTGWTTVGTTTSDVLTFTDSTEQPATSGTPLQISYVVVTLSGGQQAGPSNCVTLTFPNVVGAATVLTGSTT
jgi:hypothetical protein